MENESKLNLDLFKAAWEKAVNSLGKKYGVEIKVDLVEKKEEKAV